MELCEEVNIMANLSTEYVDAKNIKHAVEHLTLSTENHVGREELVQDILNVLIRKRKG